MQVDVTQVFVLAAVIVTSRAQLTDIAGSTSVSVSPTGATCGRTSADSYCRVDVAADAGCVVHTCRTVCEDRTPPYTELLLGVSGFNYDGSVTNTTKDFGDSDVTVAEFKRNARLAFLKGSVNMSSVDKFTLALWMKPNGTGKERSVTVVIVITECNEYTYAMHLNYIHYLSLTLFATFYSLTQSLTHPTTHPPNHPNTHPLTHSPFLLTHTITHSRTHSLSHSPTHPFTNKL